VDKSRGKLRGDRLSVEEYLKILEGFSDDVRIQFFIAFAYESLGRPQEILDRKIKDVKLYDNYAVIYISEHGKEGVGILRCVDSYAILLKLLNTHPRRDDPEAHLFLNTGSSNRFKQLRPANVNKRLRERCRKLGIAKPVTCYSFKRNGVSDLRLRGESDKSIQERARWTTTKQLHTYDIASQEETFRADLIRRGLVKADDAKKHMAPVSKTCLFCEAVNPATERTCHRCKRLLYRQDIEEEERRQQAESSKLKTQLEELRTQYASLQADVASVRAPGRALSMMMNDPKALSRFERLFEKFLRDQARGES
jgi:hypothetical protein